MSIRKGEYAMAIDGHQVMGEWDDDLEKFSWATTAHSVACSLHMKQGGDCTINPTEFMEAVFALRRELLQLRQLMEG